MRTVQLPKELSGAMAAKGKDPFLDVLHAPVAADIGGTLAKVVYIRPQSPPTLPDFIHKEKYTLPVQTPAGTVDISFLKFPSSHVVDFLEFVAESNVRDHYPSIESVNITGGGAYKYRNTIEVCNTFRFWSDLRIVVKSAGLYLFRTNYAPVSVHFPSPQLPIPRSVVPANIDHVSEGFRFPRGIPAFIF